MTYIDDLRARGPVLDELLDTVTRAQDARSPQLPGGLALRKLEWHVRQAIQAHAETMSALGKSRDWCPHRGASKGCAHPEAPLAYCEPGGCDKAWAEGIRCPMEVAP